jgi:hypothetical protein
VGPDEAGMEGQLAEKRRRGRRQVGDASRGGPVGASAGG